MRQFILLITLFSGLRLVGQEQPLVITVTPASTGATLTIKNASPNSLCAYVVTWTIRDTDSRGKPQMRARRLVRDSITHPAQRPVAPYQEVSIPVGAPDSPMPKVEVPAGIFANGAAFGDPSWTALIRQRRKVYLDVITAALGTVERAFEQHESIDALVAALGVDLTSKRGAAQAAIEADIKAAPEGSADALFDATSDEMKAANFKRYSDEDQKAAVDGVYSTLISNLRRVHPTESLERDPQVGGLTKMLKERRERLLAATH
jgi:hypothetical protein